MKEINPKDEYEFSDLSFGEGTTEIKYKATRKADRKVFLFNKTRKYSMLNDFRSTLTSLKFIKLFATKILSKALIYFIILILYLSFINFQRKKIFLNLLER
jgi:hypothetical protein